MKRFFFILFTLFSTSLFAHTQLKVVVVGAGLSGLTTAYRLQQKGFDVEVFEARNRVGGRVFLVNIFGHVCELGGQNIADGGEAKNFRHLINELGLEVEQKKSKSQLYYVENGLIIDIKALIRAKHFNPQELRAQLEALRQTSSSMQEVFQSLFAEDEILYKACEVMLKAYEGAPIDKLSSHYVETLYHQLTGGFAAVHPGSSEEVTYFQHDWVNGGNSRLPEKLSQQLSRPVRLKHVLKSLAKNESDRYLLSFENGESVEADILVLTLPCPVYKNIAIEASVIPSSLLAKICSIQYGTTTKIVVPIMPKLHSGAFTNGRIVTFLNGDCHALNMYYVGYHGQFTKDTLEETFQKELPFVQLFYSPLSCSPKIAADQLLASYECPVGHSWLNDPFAQGSYSCMGPGQEILLTSLVEVAGERVRTLFAPLDECLFFAGEHTTLLFNAVGTMEAAVESGERMARLIAKIHQ